MHPAMRNYQGYLYSCYGTVMVIVVWKINCAVVFNILTLGASTADVVKKMPF